MLVQNWIKYKIVVVAGLKILNEWIKIISVHSVSHFTIILWPAVWSIHCNHYDTLVYTSVNQMSQSETFICIL